MYRPFAFADLEDEQRNRWICAGLESGAPLIAGSGACKACDCRGFRPTGKRNDVCAFCGHMWDRHW